MATRNANLRVGIEGERDYKQAISEINRGTQVLNSEMKKLSEEYKGNEDSIEALNKKSDLLQRQLEQQKDKVQTLKDALKNAADTWGEADKRTDSWKIQLNNAEREQIKLERALKETTDAIDNEGKETDDTSDALQDYSKNTDEASNKTSIFAGVLKADLVHDAISAAIDGLKRLGEMAIDFGKTVIESYGELEQNLGGAEAVFGEYADTVRNAAEQAYRTMGASESEYLATANKIGALFQGSGVEVERSMELTMEAMQRAADAASVMGIDTSAALEAVTGAAKGNYTMMDNLGVKMDATTLKAYALQQGMSKTWEEMNNAEKAELAMQYFFEQTEKYAGNFEQEARQTISGSIGMLQASVSSWVAGLGDAEADIDVLTGNVIDSFETVVENVIPIVENVIRSAPQIYDSVMTAVSERSPELAEKLENFVNPLKDILQALWDLGVSIWPVVEPVLDGLAWGLQQISEILENLVGWAETAIGWLQQVYDFVDAHEVEVTGYENYGFGGPAYNAAGDSSWRGGLTWVGEGGPELVELPRGSRIYSNQESQQLVTANSGTDVSRIEAMLSRGIAMLDRIERDLADAEAIRRMA